MFKKRLTSIIVSKITKKKFIYPIVNFPDCRIYKITFSWSVGMIAFYLLMFLILSIHDRNSTV